MMWMVFAGQAWASVVAENAAQSAASAAKRIRFRDMGGSSLDETSKRLYNKRPRVPNMSSQFSPQPALALHHQVKEDLLLKLRSGIWQPGREIPPEPALCAHYRVSRGTLRRAIGDLVNEGYLERFRGRGTFVSPPKLESRFAGSFGRFTVIGPSLEPKSRVLFSRRVRRPHQGRQLCRPCARHPRRHAALPRRAAHVLDERARSRIPHFGVARRY